MSPAGPSAGESRLAPGARLGPYEILGPLGSGGMGEVHRARDTRLGRTVAIKVLPSDRMADESRRRRFVQEARAASALNHPSIVTIYEIESADGVDFIVMEYVDGTTLDNVIPRRGMRLGEVLRIAIPIADALAQAHAAGIVHRDLKPANLMVGPDGFVKVLDFGLAKLATCEPERADHETLSESTDASPLSRPGTIAGTAGYMSPEQAMGKAVDARSDIFSFGAVLYEMVTGRRAFAGDSTAETLAAVVRDQPRAPSEVVPGVPKELERLIQRSLRKEPERRLQHMLDVKVELQEIKEESESGHAAATVPARSKRRRWLLAGLAGILATATGLRLLLRPTPPTPRLVPVTNMRGNQVAASLSPDGDEVAFAWDGEKQDNFDLYIKAVGSSDMRRLTTDPTMDIMPAWSPDGKQIAFVHEVSDGQRIHLISPIAGSDREVSDFPVAFWTPSWSPDGRWLAVGRAPKAPGPGLFAADGLFLLPVNGGEPRPLRIPQEARATACPTFSPDGRRLAYLSGSDFSQYVAVVDLGADYMPTGAPRRVTRRPIYTDGGYSWTRDGKSIVYVEWGVHRLWRVDVAGDRAAEPIEIAGFGAIRPTTATGRDRLAFVQEQDDTDIYKFEVGRPAEPVITSTSKEANPQFSPDGRRVAFESERSGDHEIWLAGNDGSSPRQLTRGPGLMQRFPRWSPDGRRIAFDSRSEDGVWSIWTIDADGASPRRLNQDPGSENFPDWSRDGRFIYFTKGSSGVWRLPATGGTEEQMTLDGLTASESIDGKTLFFVRDIGDAAPLWAQPLGGGPPRQIAACMGTRFAVGPGGVYALDCWRASPASLFLRDPTTGQGRLLGKLERASQGGLTVSPDGKTFLYTRDVNGGSDLMMIENFR